MPLHNFGIVAHRSEDAFEDYVIMRCAQPDAAGLLDLYAIVPGSFVSYRLSDSGQGPMSIEVETELLAARTIGCRVVHDPRLGSIGMDPDVATLKAIAADVQAIYQGRESVVIHCRHGRERTGGVCAAWRLIYGGATWAQVQDDLKAYGIDGITAVFDRNIVEAVWQIARELGR